LIGQYAGDTEIIVIPNGPDNSWMTLQAEFQDDTRIRFHYVPKGDQCLARNMGIDLAHGELIRFLDDDDYLFPEEAAQQYKILQDQPDIDFCSAAITLENQEGHTPGQLFQPICNSPLEAFLGAQRVQIPLAHVYRRQTLDGIRWREGLRQSEDIVWLVDYMTAAPRRWVRMDESVGVWYQHSMPRQSLDRPSGRVHEATAQALLAAVGRLQKQERWTPQLAVVVADALWSLVHRAFPFRPFYWHGIATYAQTLNRDSRPPPSFYKNPIFKQIDPKILLWGILPKRWINLIAQTVYGLLAGRDYRRTL
jgi:glycosyltransferase involved in cell wall biosynthesis